MAILTFCMRVLMSTAFLRKSFLPLRAAFVVSIPAFGQLLQYGDYDDSNLLSSIEGMLWNILSRDARFLLTENSVRHIDMLREMETHKRHYQIRCSHHELELSATDKRITCAICGKNWVFVKERGYSDPRQVYTAEKDE